MLPAITLGLVLMAGILAAAGETTSLFEDLSQSQESPSPE